MKSKRITLALIFAFAFGMCLANAAVPEAGDFVRFPTPLSDYNDPAGATLRQVLKSRVKEDPFNLYATIIFVLAIIHTLSSRHFNEMGNRIEEEHRHRLKALERQGKIRGEMVPVSFKGTIFHFLGEVEAIFGIWLIPLFAGMVIIGGWSSMTQYVDTLAFVEKKYTEPMFVVVIMAIAASKPIVLFAGRLISHVARLGKSTPTAWWISIIAIGPLMGSFITEPAAITICALLLSKKFFRFAPSTRLKYATLGILLTSISVGGTLTHFAAPPVLMVAIKWEWNTLFMLEHFGAKAVVGILASIAAYYFIFRKEFAGINKRAGDTCALEDQSEFVPTSVIAVHLFFLAFTVFNLHHPAIVIFSFLFFIAYIMATQHYQYEMQLKTPILVGFFLAALVTHGTMQAWWIEPILSRLSNFQLFGGALGLSMFNDNAAITYLGTLVPEFGDHQRYLLVSGAVLGGGLTVIANAPNPAGLSILSKHFSNGVAPLSLFLGAIGPTILIAAIFYLF